MNQPVLPISDANSTDKSLRVLIVEDSEDDALLLVRQLRQGGYRVEFERVETSGAMRAALEAQTWDLAIADYTLPQFSAPAALALLQSMGIDLPFIVVSGTIGENRAVAAMKSGAHDYLMKGNLARLLPAIERELREAKERQQRRLAEQALRRNEQQFRALIENASDIILLLDGTGTVRYASPSVRRILAIDPKQVRGQPLTNWLHPDDRAAAADVLASVLATDESVKIAEWRWRDREGAWRVFEAIVKPFSDDAARLTGCVVSARDITTRLRMEEMRRALERERELSELKLRFFSMASHEFRTPLSVILVAAQLLEHSAPDWLDAGKLRNLHRIQDATKSMSQMLTDILTIARAEAQKLDFNPQPVNLLALCREIVEEMESAYAQQSSRIRLAFSGQEDVCLDTKLLHSIWTNLLSNALKYSSPENDVLFEVSVEDGLATFQVVDRGIGIPEGDLPHLFELFSRGSNVGKVDGSGLGLAVVKKCTERHGGSVTLESGEGVGTTFIVQIPVTHRRSVTEAVVDVPG